MREALLSLPTTRPACVYLGYLVPDGKGVALYVKPACYINVQQAVFNAPPDAIAFYFFSAIPPGRNDSLTDLDVRKPIGGNFYIRREQPLLSDEDRTLIGTRDRWFLYRSGTDRVIVEADYARGEMLEEDEPTG